MPIGGTIAQNAGANVKWDTPAARKMRPKESVGVGVRCVGVGVR